MHNNKAGSDLESLLERFLYASRWLLALGIKFFQEVIHIFPQILAIKESQLILALLTLIDLTLVGSLIVIVMFSGYENFVSQLNITEDTEKLDWLGTHDYGSLKMKVASSIVAISSIHLLKVFMDVERINNEKIQWYVVIHLTLVSYGLSRQVK